MMYRMCGDLLFFSTCMSLGTGVEIFLSFQGEGLLAKHIFLGPTHLRCDLFDDFLLLWICLFSLGLFFSWAGWISHFFKDLEAETIHVCIAWALLKYLGLFFFVFIAGLHISFYLGSCISVWGWLIRDTHCFLPVAGWDAKPWDAELFFI